MIHVERARLRAPFPWFGGKSRVAHLVWDRFGDVPNYVEPFAGSLAVLLGRPHEPKVETVNDVDCYLANFWRAVTADPEATAAAADWPINEADLHARHRWLTDQATFRERMKSDPDYFDAKIAGWWVWGVSQWIGSGWCSGPSWTERRGCHNCVPLARQMPCLHGDHGATGRGIHASGLTKKLPRMDRGTESRLAMKTESLLCWFVALQGRLRNVRVCCGDWLRILGPSPTIKIGVTAVFLDPPYAPAEIAKGAGRGGLGRSDKLYADHGAGVSAEVRRWAMEHGENPMMRIALCGYDGEHSMPASWSVVAWKGQGGYSNRGSGARRNAERERIWFSPHCLRPHQGSLLPTLGGDSRA